VCAKIAEEEGKGRGMMKEEGRRKEESSRKKEEDLK